MVLQVLGLNNKSQQVVQIEDDSDDEILVHAPEKENIYISEEEVEEVVEMEMPLAESSPRREYGGGGEGGGGGGWGECPVCDQVRRVVCCRNSHHKVSSQLMPTHKLALHAMACQGLHLNGGEGLEVNPMEVQTRCSMCDCLVPDLVIQEHMETCWANNRNKRRIETPMERRKNKFPKTSHLR